MTVQFINEYGPSAQDRALSLADATRHSGLRDECAEFYLIVARIVAGARGEHAASDANV